MFWNVKESAPVCSQDQVTLFYYVAADNKEDWANGIFHNGKYGIFKYGTKDKKLELVSSHYEMPKFRKCGCLTSGVAEVKIKAWLAKYAAAANIILDAATAA